MSYGLRVPHRIMEKTFEKLNIWQRSIELAKRIYQLSASSGFARDFGLKDQIRRASISISSNIAEDFERNNNKEYARFLLIAEASAGEVLSQPYLAKELNYVNDRDAFELIRQIRALIRSIGCLVSRIRSRNP